MRKSIIGVVLFFLVSWSDLLFSSPEPTRDLICSKTVTIVSEAQSAVNASVAGQTVCLEPGTYNFTVAFYPRSGVRIYCKPGAKLAFDGGSQEAVRFNTNVTGATVEGCEITGGWDGIKVTGQNNKVINNWIHHNRYQGVLTVSSNNTVIEGNKIEYNGVTGGCSDPGWAGYPNSSPRHCHAIYFSNHSGACINMTGNKVINNYLGNQPGGGVTFNGETCPNNWIDDTLISGNTFNNNAAGIIIYKYARNIMIQDNSFKVTDYPQTDMTKSNGLACIAYWSATSSVPSLINNTYEINVPNYVWLRKL